MRRTLLTLALCVLLPLVASAQGRITPSRTTLPFLTLNGDLTMGAGTQITFDGGTTLDGNTTDQLDQRNGTSAQTWRLYNTFTDSSNGEWGQLAFSSDDFVISTQENGSGTVEDMYFIADGDLLFDAEGADIHFQRQTYTAMRADLANASTGPEQVVLAVNGNIGATSGTQSFLLVRGTFNPPSGTPTDRLFSILPTINWGGTPGAGNYEALFIDATETAIPTGTNYLIRAQVDASDVWGVTAGGIVATAVQAVTVDAATTFAVTSQYITLACTGAEAIDTITGGLTGMRLVIEHTDTDCTLNDDDDATAANAIDLEGAATNDVGAVGRMVQLMYNGTYWVHLGSTEG